MVNSSRLFDAMESSMFCFKKPVALISLLAATSANAGPGINDITFTGTGMSPTGSWPIGHEWTIRAILTDSTGKAIGFLSPSINLNTAGGASFPIGFEIMLGAGAPKDAIINVYRSTATFNAGDAVERAEYDGVCMPSGCASGLVTVPASSALLNSDFRADNTALPVTLQSISVD
jgi:hypothetical protein